MAVGKLEGKVALVTGASTGIGRATAIAFAKEGAKVVVAARSEDKLKAVVEEITSAGGEALYVVGDVTKEADCKSMVDKAVDSFGGLHVAFNNAGLGRMAPFVDMTEDLTNLLLDTNVKSLVFCFKHQIPAMAKTGDKGSIIVNTSSTAHRTTTALPGAGVYAASKAAAEMLMKYAAIEGAASGIRVNSIAPGRVETPAYGDMPLDMLADFARRESLIGRLIQSEECAKTVVFLASDDAAPINGSTILADGGWSVKA